MPNELAGKTVLITGAARRLGYYMALTVARAGANVILHHAHSEEDAAQAKLKIQNMGVHADVICADLGDPQQAKDLIPKASQFRQIDALVNSASIFKSLVLTNTSLADWQEHLNINLTAPFLLSQAFAAALPENQSGRIINILDWRTDRPGADHFPYTVSKSSLAALTKSLAVALAPRILVNGLALGAILPSSDSEATTSIIKNVPAARWATLEEVGQALMFLLSGPEYITGEIIHLDGGRHLV
jgi:NAD(P)-dependent dehydrogenase (short-subunit alcohol dehydrogenase family)